MKETIDTIQLKKSQFKMLIYVSILLFLLFAGFTIYWEITYHSNLNKLISTGEYVEVEARVIDHTTRGNKVYDVITFKADGADHERVYFEPSNHKVGSTIVIYYEASNPAFGGLMAKNSMTYWLPIIVVLFGGIEALLLYLYHSLNIAKHSTTHRLKTSTNEAQNNDVVEEIVDEEK